jgi:DNA-binding transcriptional LysR family regulator
MPMQLSQIDLNLFTVFDAIYREGGITAASKRLHLSQSAVSHALARLREVLNDPLFERHGNEMIPTPRARELAGTINQSLGGLEKALHRAESFSPTTLHRSFIVAMRESHETTFLPSMAEALSREAPGVSVATVRIERRDVEDDLQSGDLDIAVDMALPVSTDVRQHRVSAEPLVVLARKDHPVIRGELDLATYLAMDHVLVTGRRRGRGLEDAALQRLNVARSIRVRCQQYGAANEIVSRSDLLATVPRNYALYVNKNAGNQVLPFPAEEPTLELFVYWHNNVEDDPGHRWFRELALRFI